MSATPPRTSSPGSKAGPTGGARATDGSLLRARGTISRHQLFSRHNTPACVSEARKRSYNYATVSSHSRQTSSCCCCCCFILTLYQRGTCASDPISTCSRSILLMTSSSGCSRSLMTGAIVTYCCRCTRGCCCCYSVAWVNIPGVIDTVYATVHRQMYSTGRDNFACVTILLPRRHVGMQSRAVFRKFIPISGAWML